MKTLRTPAPLFLTVVRTKHADAHRALNARGVLKAGSSLPALCFIVKAVMTSSPAAWQHSFSAHRPNILSSGLPSAPPQISQECGHVQPLHRLPSASNSSASGPSAPRPCASGPSASRPCASRPFAGAGSPQVCPGRSADPPPPHL